MGAFGLTENRNRLIDYPYATTTSSMALMIAKPTIQMSNHISAVAKPFETEVRTVSKYALNESFICLLMLDDFKSKNHMLMLQVWIYLAFSVVIGVISLYAVLRCVSWIIDPKGMSKEEIVNEFTRFNKAMVFIFGLLVLQGL